MKLSELEKEWVRIMDNSTDPQEIIETAAKLKMEPFTSEEAKDLAGMNERAQARRAEREKEEGLLTQGEILEILSGEVSPEEMIRRWENEGGG